MPAILSFALLVFATLLPAAAPARPKAPAAVSDTSVEQSIRARFAKSKISADNFTVRVQGGVAIIEGSTAVIQRKGVATRLAKLGGARAVDNRIRISDAARQKAAESLKKHTSETPKHKSESPKPAAATRPAGPAPAAPAKTATPLPQTLATAPESPAKSIPRAQVKH
jgi:hypothetical protein